MIKVFIYLGVAIYITIYITAAAAKGRGDIWKVLLRNTPLFIALIAGATLFIDVINTKIGGYVIYSVLFLALIFTGVGLAVIHTVIPYLINKLEHVKKHADNTASDFDNANAPSDEHVIGETAESEEIRITVRHNIWWIIPCGLLFLPQIVVMASNSDINAWAIILSIFGALVLYWSFSCKIIFDEFGITIDDPDKSTFLPWNTIAGVDAFSMAGRIDTRFVFRNKENKFVIISEVWHKNGEESLKYAVTKLPPGVFDTSARKRLSEMCICDLD